MTADNKIGDEGARGLSEGLKTNTTLTAQDLRSEQRGTECTRDYNKHDGTWCDCADNEIAGEGARGLGDALKANTTLTELDLGGELQNQENAARVSTTVQGETSRQQHWKWWSACAG